MRLCLDIVKHPSPNQEHLRTLLATRCFLLNTFKSEGRAFFVVSFRAKRSDRNPHSKKARPRPFGAAWTMSFFLTALAHCLCCLSSVNRGQNPHSMNDSVRALNRSFGTPSSRGIFFSFTHSRRDYTCSLSISFSFLGLHEACFPKLFAAR